MMRTRVWGMGCSPRLTDQSVRTYHSSMTENASPNKPPSRALTAAARREAIVNAALEEFAEKGFASTRMEDIARRAGVAKGTIYLNFNNKEALFEAIVKQEIRPRVDAASAIALTGGSLQELVKTMLLPVLDDLIHSRRGAVLRMLIGEAGRFPALAEVYYRVVIEPGMLAIRAIAQRAKESGSLRDNLLVEFPQLLMAPVVLAVIWTGLFEKYQPLEVNRMIEAYFTRLIPIGSTGGSTSAATSD
jgi:AcrR family transcriptional regulator